MSLISLYHQQFSPVLWDFPYLDLLNEMIAVFLMLYFELIGILEGLFNQMVLVGAENKYHAEQYEIYIPEA